MNHASKDFDASKRSGNKQQSGQLSGGPQDFRQALAANLRRLRHAKAI
jgi:hypothetical protein